MRIGRWLPVALLAVAPRLPAQEARPVDFEKDIRPVFARACSACHGPQKQKSGYRLDLKTAALGEAVIGRPIVPGKGADSPLLRYISGADPDLRMPPKGPRLSAEEVGLIRAWIDQGAPWPDDSPAVASPDGIHWSFRPVSRPEPPAGKGRNEIDRFIATRLGKEGLAPSPEADRRTLIRRVSFDVTGLPPSPEESEAFENDRRPDAFERLVDRLLDSPRYGERWARHWLDVVRFAESHGFEKNQNRPNAWPYRDYVIRALNEDRPYDRFVREQIAGDATGADEATGFLVAGPMDEVKSPDPVLTAQQRADELNDMVSTTGTAFLGLTLGCARCHDHKFDPIPQTDYTALVALLAGVEHGERPVRPPDAEERLRRAQELQVERAPIDEQLSRFEARAHPGRVLLLEAPQADREPYAKGTGRGQAGDPGDERRFPTLGRGGVPDAAWTPQVAGHFRVWVSWSCGAVRSPHAQYLLDGREIVRLDQRAFADRTAADPNHVLWSGFFDAGARHLTNDSRLEIREGNGDVLLLVEEPAPAAPALRPPVTRGVNVERFEPVEARFVRFTILETSQLEPCIDELEVFTTGPGRRNVALSSGGATARASGTLPGFDLHKLEHLNDGLYGNARSWISDERGRGWVELEFPRAERIDRIVWSRDRDNVPRYEDRLATKYRVEVSLDGKEWTRVASSDDRVPRGRIPGELLPTIQPLTAEESAERAGLLKRRGAIDAEVKKLLAFPMIYAGRFVKPAAIRRLHRGDVTQPREPALPGVLTRLGPVPAVQPSAPDLERRKALADWIVDPGHPLTARVLVNRLWQHHFGEGIVATPSDFGANGARPSHPELLDWLASEFVAKGWSQKAIHRLILTSATWRQASASRADGMKIDAGSRLLWRFPPRRLEAEPLRDAILGVSGVLETRMGGPGFDLFEPNGNYVKVYTPKTKFGAGDYRRMIYQSKPRMELDPVFGAFDCPDGGQVAPRRNVSTTPLQAMSLLNSAFILQQSDLLAARLERDAGASSEDRIRRAFRLAFGRDPSSPETASAATLVLKHGLPALCRALFNANEFVTVY
jgi:mono/diheme cytochrome c family protein